MPEAPDFIGVGAEAVGGPWWLSALTRHPEITGPRGRRGALHFFDEFCTRELVPADVAAYHARFPPAGGQLRGEWTERYMCDGWTPTLLARAAPEAKLLVLLRDPIERFRAARAECLAVLPEGKRLLVGDVVDRSAHAFQLRRLHHYFAPDRVLVLQLERCLAYPEAEYRHTLRFLGVRDDFVPQGLVGGGGMLQRLRGRVPALELPPTDPLWPELEAALHEALDPDVAELCKLVPELDLSLWPNFAHLARA